MPWEGKNGDRSDFGKAPLNLLGGGLWRWSETPPLEPLIRSRIIAAEIGVHAPNGCEPTAFVFRRDAKFT
jgi:hypothetical protein